MLGTGKEREKVQRFLTSASYIREWSASSSGQFPVAEKFTAIKDGSLVGPRVGLDVMAKKKILTLPGIEAWSKTGSQ